jgi:hypothetical protein
MKIEAANAVNAFRRSSSRLTVNVAVLMGSVCSSGHDETGIAEHSPHKIRTDDRTLQSQAKGALMHMPKNSRNPNIDKMTSSFVGKEQTQFATFDPLRKAAKLISHI